VAGVFDKPLDINYLLGFFNSLVKHRTIVIVDDDPAFCKTLDDILSHRGFKVMQINNPHNMDTDMLTSGVQTILLDMKLNGFNGLDVLKRIRVQYPTLPVIIVTAHRQEMSDAIQAALEINAYACLYKPLEIPKLLQLLSEVQLENLRSLLKR
jgi:DNA-binding response OmpR family regulator